MRKKKIEIKKITNMFSNQKGMALLTTLIFVFVLVSFAVALLTMTSNDTKLSTLQRESTRAFYLAETGIEKALWNLNTPIYQGGKGLKWRTDETGSSIPLHDNVTTNEYYDVTVLSNPTGQTDKIKITSIGTVKEGKYSSGKRKIEVTAKKGVKSSPGLSYDHAIFTNGDMTFNGDINISGSIHSNEDIIISSTQVFDLENGIATACGTNDYDNDFSNQPPQDFPSIAWDYFQSLAEKENQYYDEDLYIFSIPDDNLTGIYFINGDVKIKTNITLTNATIFATGTITVYPAGDVTLGNELADHPLAIVAKKDITLNGGKIHGEGIIQTEGNFVNQGAVEINEGAIYAELGTFNGGGPFPFNVSYGSDLAANAVPGTGVPVYIKTSWRETY